MVPQGLEHHSHFLSSVQCKEKKKTRLCKKKKMLESPPFLWG